MVLNETHQLVLVIETSGEMQSMAFRVVAFQPIVEPLVVAIVETELHQLPFQVPIDFRQKKQVGVLEPHGGDHLAPVLFWWVSTDTPIPRVLKDAVEQQHRHIAAYSVALLGNQIQCLAGCPTQARTEGVELCDIRPRREVRIASVGNHCSTRLKKCAWHLRQILACPLHKVFGMLEDPGVIRCHMIGYKIQDQAQASLHEHLPRRAEPLWSAEMCIHDVSTHTVSRADIIRRGIVWQCAKEIGLQAYVFVRNTNSLWASLPDPHQPYGIHTERGKRIPLFRWNSA